MGRQVGNVVYEVGDRVLYATVEGYYAQVYDCKIVRIGTTFELHSGTAMVAARLQGRDLRRMHPYSSHLHAKLLGLKGKASEAVTEAFAALTRFSDAAEAGI